MMGTKNVPKNIIGTDAAEHPPREQRAHQPPSKPTRTLLPPPATGCAGLEPEHLQHRHLGPPLAVEIESALATTRHMMPIIAGTRMYLMPQKMSSNAPSQVPIAAGRGFELHRHRVEPRPVVDQLTELLERLLRRQLHPDDVDALRPSSGAARPSGWQSCHSDTLPVA